jgi:hypothetical protein
MDSLLKIGYCLAFFLLCMFVIGVIQSQKDYNKQKDMITKQNSEMKTHEDGFKYKVVEIEGKKFILYRFGEYRSTWTLGLVKLED